MQISLPQRSYNIQNDVSHYYAGHLKDGSQVLMGIQLPELVMVEFAPTGKYVRTTIRDISSETRKSLQRLPNSGEDDLLRELRNWQQEVGFTGATISIQQFFLSDRYIGIKNLPDHYQEVLNQPEEYDANRRRELQEDVHLWIERGDFVLYWDEEYYLNQDGELESS